MQSPNFLCASEPQSSNRKDPLAPLGRHVRTCIWLWVNSGAAGIYDVMESYQTFLDALKGTPFR